MESVIKKRIYCFDLLKIISIIIVFFHHIMMDMYVVHPMHNLKILEDIIVRPNMNLGMIACGMFILISGATIALKGKEEEPIEFYKKRLIRILIPFYIAYIINFIIRVINLKTIHVFGGVPKWRIIFTIIGMDEYIFANGYPTFSLGVGEWFLGCIMLCYLLYPFLYRLHRKNKIIVFSIMTIYFIFINYFYGMFKFVIPSHMNFFCQIYNFYLGIVLIDKNMLSKYRKWMLLVTIPIFIVFYFIKIPFMIPDNIKTTIVLVALFITFYVLEEYISKIKLLTDFTVFFNKISLEIYLVHHFIIYQVDYVLGYRNLSGVETLLVVIFDMVVIVILSIMVGKLSGVLTNFVYKTKK